MQLPLSCNSAFWEGGKLQYDHNLEANINQILHATVLDISTLEMQYSSRLEY